MGELGLLTALLLRRRCRRDAAALPPRLRLLHGLLLALLALFGGQIASGGDEKGWLLLRWPFGLLRGI